jgi:dolichyl-phosphate-mannose--protein O-mannosyl transferase
VTPVPQTRSGANGATLDAQIEAAVSPQATAVTPGKVLLSCLLLYAIAQVFFALHLGFPRTPNFDEFHYIPSAKQFLAWKENQNWEHPPLGKQLIALSIRLWGDNPVGWRMMSTVFGSLTLVGMFLWALAVFQSISLGFWVAAITLSNQLLYVQARIAMLDTFMWAFCVWAIAAFCAAWNSPGPHFRGSAAQGLPFFQRKSWLLAFSGLFFGLATACKWIAVVPWLLCLGLVFFARAVSFFFQTTTGSDNRLARFAAPFLPDGLFAEVPLGSFLLRLLVAPLLVYLATFLPFLWVERTPAYGLGDLLTMQVKMWEGQQRVITKHPYMSDWTSWPFMTRPIWYAFDREPGHPEWVRGVLLLGNPLIMWGGFLALGATVGAWLEKRSRQAFLISVFYLALVLCWAVIPRKVAFYYYYYPAGMTLSLAIAFCFQRWLKKPVLQAAFVIAAFALFIYFLPVLSGMKIPTAGFRRWMWLSSWI